MKIFTLNLITAMIMVTNPIRTELIGKHISEIPNAILENDTSSKGKWYKTNGNYDFLGKPYNNNLSIVTDKKDIIQYYYFSLRGQMDRMFFDKMTEEFGHPTVMYKMDQMVITSSSVDALGIRGTAMTGRVKECMFEDNPVFIFWDKEGYSIHANLGSQRSFNIQIGNKDFMLAK